MSSKFECIKAVKDADFNTKLSDLYERCLAIEQMEKISPTDCVSIIRIQNERLAKYLYCRLMGEKETRLTTFEILNNNTFKKKISNSTLIKWMDRLRSDGNETTHEDAIEIDGPMAASIGITTFSFVVKKVCEIVDNLPADVVKPYLKGKVSITLKETLTERGTIHRCLVAEIKNCNASRDALRYKWVEIQENGKITELQKGRLNHFDLTAGFIPKTYQCIVTSAETMGKRKSSKYCTEIISNEKNIQKGDQLPKSTDLTKKPAKSASEVPEHEDNILEMTKGSTVQPLQKKGIPSSKNSQETKVEKNLLVSAEAVACRNGVVHPMKLPSQRTLLFDSTHGLVHYFVLPNDEFALNSLELLSADVYLYRLLRQEGYDRIAFVDVGNVDCRIYAYDLNSASVFKTNLSEEEKELQRIDSIKAVQPETQIQDQSLFGKREIRRLPREETAKKEFIIGISSALKDKHYKTAIVIPIFILEKGGYYGDDIVDIINRIEREGNQGNVLIFTMTQRDDILYCFNERGSRIYSWASPIMTKVRQGAVDQAREAVESLRKRGLIVLADEYETDEIANLLFRKKLIEKKELLINLPMQKIYPLAAKLKEHCLQIRKHFIQIGYQDRRDSCIRQLNILLDRKEVQEELIQVAVKVRDATIGVTKGLHPMFLERVYHISLGRFEDDSSAIVEKAAEGMLAKEMVHKQGVMCQVETLKRPDKNLFDRMRTPYPREKITAKHCAKLVDPAVLLVKTKTQGAQEMQGTGFLVHPDGYVLTCEHVIRDADKIEVIRRVQRSEDANDYKDENYICKLIYKDVFCDIALLKFESEENALPYLPLSTASRVINRGEEYIISGYPYVPGYDSTLTLYSGYISAAHEMQGLTLWYIDGKAQPGNSGSPVISLEDSSVIGILKGGLEEGDSDDNYMIPIKYFWEEILG